MTRKAKPEQPPLATPAAKTGFAVACVLAGAALIATLAVLLSAMDRSDLHIEEMKRNASMPIFQPGGAILPDPPVTRRERHEEDEEPHDAFMESIENMLEDSRDYRPPAWPSTPEGMRRKIEDQNERLRRQFDKETEKRKNPYKKDQKNPQPVPGKHETHRQR